ncbi:DNA alkylation repair protein [Thermoanaerobacterium sp. RBIITD]|uniref:DNA alkylation repair protein n=1 Tax=Thermoanaerobacterium sp. RBIITD TaxID=1550240 RepID=UPI0018D4F3D4|nr:DNA alkylation repair protein [Thermoanaerobacterium sp. RBIITD]
MDIFKTFYKARDDENAAKMSAYMKNKFSFLGIPKPMRTKLSKNFINQKKMEGKIDWQFIFECYGMPEREFHYLALDYLNAVKDFLIPETLII